MIKAVFLDWGYTLIGSFKEIDAELDCVLKPFDTSWQEIFPHWRNFYFLRSMGRIKTDEEMGKQMSKVLQFPRALPLEQIRSILVESHIIQPETIEVIRELRLKYHLGIISNNICEWVKQTLENYHLSGLFETIVCSSEVGARKPDARIFFAALNRANVSPQEAVFVSDELGEDLVGSKGMGMFSIWLDTGIKNAWKKPEERFFEPDAIISRLSELPKVLERISQET